MRTFLIFVGCIVGAYAALALLLYLVQPRLVWLPQVPGRELVATPGALGLRYEDVELRAEDGVRLHGWYLPAGAADAPVLLLCHGNAGNISHRLDLLRIFRGLGWGVLAFDYRGYGRSEGRPSEAGTYLDAAAAWRHLVEVRGHRPERIVVFGESLGGGPASHLAAAVQPGALILASTFTSIPDIAALHYPFLPVRRLARIRYPVAEHVSGVRSPTLVIHSPEDEIVPFELGREVHRRAAAARKAFLEIRGDHNSGFLVSEATFAAGIEQFMAPVLNSPQ